MSVELKHLSGDQWQTFLKLLGTGDFFRIEFRPPRPEEELLGPVNGIKRGSWWVCEADYADTATDSGGGVVRMHFTTRVFPFRLYELENEDGSDQLPGDEPRGDVRGVAPGDGDQGLHGV